MGTGSIEVTVVTSELQPVAQAEVVLFGTAFAAYTDEAGIVTFTGLEPGNYTVVAAKPGYKAVQERGRAIDVLSDDPAEVRLTLDPVQVATAENSYHKTIPFTG
ncbi:MAG TPA: carboxypeptidase-like regulatory domain-containing protein, partial [Candidatus Thermoplasmatota archaeon]|nr:carboxypeptidase-like regulatory domain-containing protein [Candidatus Thermoplasmatota archaeon]